MKSRINREAREISISELWWYVISKWKWLVIGMVLGAIVLGIAGTYKSYKAYESSGIESLEKIAMDDLTEEEQIEVEELIADYEFYLTEVESLENDYLMSLDYNNITYWLVTYYVDTDYSYNYLNVEENYATTLISMYKTYIHSDEMYDKLRELNIPNLNEKDMGYIYSASNEGNIIKIGIAADDNYCELIKDTLCTSLEEYKQQADKYIGEHEFVKVSEDVRLAYADGIKNAQNYKVAIVNALFNEIEQLKTNFTDNQIAVYDEIVAELNGELSDEITEKLEKPKLITFVNLKFIFIGIVAGMAIVVFVVVTGYICNRRIKSLNEITQVYNIDILGKVLRDDVPNREILGKINRINSSVTELKQKEYIAQAIINECKKNSVTEIAICSSIKDVFKSNLEIFEKISKEEIVCNYIEDINYNQDALNKAIESKNIIIIELLNETRKNDLEDQIEICDKFSINILGMIVII